MLALASEADFDFLPSGRSIFRSKVASSERMAPGTYNQLVELGGWLYIISRLAYNPAHGLQSNLNIYTHLPSTLLHFCQMHHIYFNPIIFWTLSLSDVSFYFNPTIFCTQMHHIYFNPTIFWTLRHIIFYFNPTTFWTLCSPPSLTTSSAFIRANTHWCHCRPACNHNTQADAGHSSSLG